MTAQVSVIIVSYHTGPTLWLTLASALQQAECGEVIVVNNGNMPGDEKRLREMAANEPRIKLLSGHGNVGFGKGNNLGVSAATCEYVLLLNPDSMLPEGGMAALLAEMARFPENTLAGCYLINPDGSEQRGGRRALLTPRNALAESFGLNRLLKTSENLNFNNFPMPENTHEVPAVSGAFMLLARSFYQRLGGFDEGYFLHMEDMDLCYRVHKAGGRIICIPSVKVMHFCSTSEVTSAFIEKHKAKGFVRYLRQHFSEEHSELFLKLMEYGIYLRLWIKIAIGKIDRLFLPPLTARHEIARLALIYDLTRFGGQGDDLSGKTFMVTGAASQIGLCVVGKALARGARVIAVYNGDGIAFTHPRLEWKQCDLAKAKGIASFIQIKADVLISATELPFLPEVLPQLFDGGLKRAVVLSSGLIADSAHIKDSQEAGIIGMLKNAEDELLRISQERGGSVTIVRPLMLYGVGFDRDMSSMADIIKRFGRVAVYGLGLGLRNPVQARDVADAVLAITDTPKTFGKIYNIGGGETLTYREMALRLFAYIGKPARFITIPFMPAILNVLGKIYQLNHINSEVALRMNRDISFDNLEAIEDFNYRPKAFLDGNIAI